MFQWLRLLGLKLELKLIDNGKLIYAKEGRAISNENNLEIDAKFLNTIKN